jgi:hypothetical protein
MQRLGRRELLASGAGVAALAIVGTACSPARAEDELLVILNQFKAEFERFDAEHAARDKFFETHDNVGRLQPGQWKEYETAFEKRLDDYTERQHVLLESAYGVQAGAASSVAFLDMLKDEFEIGNSIFSEHYSEIMKSVRAYIASTAT